MPKSIGNQSPKNSYSSPPPMLAPAGGSSMKCHCKLALCVFLLLVVIAGCSNSGSSISTATRNEVMYKFTSALQPSSRNPDVTKVYAYLTAEEPFWELRRVGEDEWEIFMPASVQDRSGKIELLGGNSKWRFNSRTSRITPLNGAATTLKIAITGQ